MHPELLDELSVAPFLVVVRGRVHIQRLAQRAFERGELVRILPGVYAATGNAGLQVQSVALSVAHPDAVVCGRAAAALSWWPELAAGELSATVKHRVPPFPGFQFIRGLVPPELVVESNGIRLTAPTLNVLELIPELGGNVIDEALRRGVVTMDGLWEAYALIPRRNGNKERRWLLDDSRDEPWSPAERRLHRSYRGLQLPWAYRTNHHVKLPTRDAFIDLALPELRLGYEVDGYEYHSKREDFRRDRTRDPELVEAGWLIVRFDAADVDDQPDWVQSRMAGITAGRAADLGLHR